MHVEATDLARVAKGEQAPAGEAAKEKRPSVLHEAHWPERPDKQARQPEKLWVLEKFGRDLTRLAAEGKLDPVIGRRNEMRTLAGVLMQKRKNSAILIGEAGVGKTCVVEGLAQRIVGPKPPSGLDGKRIVEVTLTALVAGAKYRGDFEERMQAVVREATSDPELILFIDEIHTLMGAGGEGSSDAANILKPALARGDLRVIGATTVAEYRKYIEKDPALERRFQVVWVEEPTRQQAIEILRGLRAKLEEHHDLTISDDCVEAAVDLSMRYLADFRLPAKAIDLIDQACARARLTSFSVPPVAVAEAEVDLDAHSRMNMHPDQSHPSPPLRGRGAGVRGVCTDANSPEPSFGPDLLHAAGVIGRVDIARVVAQRCRIPLDRLTSDEAERFLHMEEMLSKRVIGQEEAVTKVCDAIRTARAGLKNPKRPMAVFLFLGSTGTGKTELAKALAEFLFGDERRLIRFDMSEYMEEHTVAKLIGAPPGYVGHDEEGQLTGPVRTNPYSVVLFDEIEKAHPRVLDIFLQIFDDGRLTDSRGRRASFTESVIILTSNLGCGAEAQEPVKGPFGFAQRRTDRPDPELPFVEFYRQSIMAAVRQAMRPELVNRIDQCVFFYPLDAQSVRRIIDKIIANLSGRLRDRRIQLHLAPAVYDLLMQQGYDPTYGAREMERAMERLIVQPLGKALLEGKFRDGDRVVAVASDGLIGFEK
ncbi:MAG: ATP-dependent Clp protease ATP-binding subunit [Planctomycetes bacterium]|nr:ATP-dependent Clp protease ATP-binding subunit [Planctomycetota bacterium]